MYDKHGRYIHMREFKDMRIFHIDGMNLHFIAHKEIPIYMIVEALEATYAPTP